MKQEIMRFVGNVKLGAKRNAPELLLGAGLITGTACIITGGFASIKANKIVQDAKDDIENTAYSVEHGTMTEDEFKVYLRATYRKNALSLAKEFAIPAVLYASTVAAIFTSYKIQKNRQVALSAALTAMTTAYTTLCAKLKNGAKHGLSADEVLNGVEVREVVDVETGEITTEKVQGDPICEPFKFRFNRESTNWYESREQNEFTLQGEEQWANSMLKVQGYLFLNDVLDRLGLPRTKAGQIIGWRSEGDGDHYVDFGIVDCETLDGAEYESNAFNLNFNVDGDILSTF